MQRSNWLVYNGHNHITKLSAADNNFEHNDTVKMGKIQMAKTPMGGLKLTTNVKSLLGRMKVITIKNITWS